ncbi:hypothetical protein QL285_064713 [Trifolium repens]|nr:hypothetical protein QL285_064713 [Trifolium repens]
MHDMPNQTGNRKMLGGNIPLDDGGGGAITNTCEREEAAMIERSHTLLQNIGVTFKDLKDVKRLAALHRRVSAAFPAQAWLQHDLLSHSERFVKE